MTDEAIAILGITTIIGILGGIVALVTLALALTELIEGKPHD